MSQPKPTLHPDTAALLGALMKRIVPKGIVMLSKQEVEEAPDVEMKENFDTGNVELRISTYTKDVEEDE